MWTRKRMFRPSPSAVCEALGHRHVAGVWEGEPKVGWAVMEKAPTGLGGALTRLLLADHWIKTIP